VNWVVTWVWLVRIVLVLVVPVSKKIKLELGMIFKEPKIGNQFSKLKPELKNQN
jgi:hypothetical protein